MPNERQDNQEPKTEVETTSEQEKRRRSSDGTTPKPQQKQVKMAANSPESPEGSGGMLDRMTVIAEAIDSLQTGQKSLQSTLDSKLDKFSKEFMSSIGDKFKAMKSDFDLELGKQQAQIDTMSRTVELIIKRLDKVETTDRAEPEFPREHEHTANIVNDPELTIIATNITQLPNENIFDVATELIKSVNDAVTVVDAARLRSRRIGRPGLVKISFSNLEEKKQVLREKRKLKEKDQYKTVFLRGSKSHTERILELNARTLLREMPNGNQFRITSNGRIVKKTPRSTTLNPEPRFEHDDHDDHDPDY